MGRLHKSFGAYLFLCPVISLSCLSQHIGIRNHRRTNLLVAIHRIFITESLDGIKTGIEGSTDFQLVVDEKIGILGYRLLVDDVGTVVLIV